MGDGRWRCICGAGERCKHDDGCRPCGACRGLGYFFVAPDPLYMTEHCATCRACDGWGRRYEPMPDVDHDWPTVSVRTSSAKGDREE
jgi:hypothetical protein